MKRLFLVLISGFLLVGLSSSCWAKTAFWVGPKGVYFHSLNRFFNEWCRPFWGFGGEAGWVVKKHLELGLDVSYVRTKLKEDMWETDESGNIVGKFNDGYSHLVISPKVAYRMLGQSSPYLGIGVGFYRGAWRFVGLSHPLPGRSASSIGTQLFAGYDYRFYKRFGLRAEGGWQIAKGKDKDYGYSTTYGDMGGQKASLGAYVAW